MDLREIKEFIKDFMGYIIVFVIIVIIFTFILAFQPIAGNSMTPTLEEGDIVLVSKIAYVLKDIERFDIVILKTSTGKQYVKRIIGLPGERIDHLNGALLINDRGINEDFLAKDTITSNFMLEDICSSDICPNGVIPKDKYLVLGDYREDSYDSRDSELGLINKKDIKGKVMLRVWPVNEIESIK